MASSSSSSPSAPDFPSRYSYHVFLSFRGDIRKDFVGHLYSALKQKGIQTYKDDKNLPQGETIEPALMKAIGESQMAILVLSEKFGDSSYCLDELVQIMKCKKTRGQIVMPVFYKVDPSEVGEQKGKFGKAFQKHDLKEAKIDSWREALEAVSNISGFHYEDPVSRVTKIHGTDLPMCRDESKFIRDIVEEVSRKMRPLNSGVDTNLIGVEERMEELKSKLQFGSGGVRMIGIWGVGGGGKTTLAYSVYKAVSMEFDGCSFVENVREKSSKKGLESLQEDLVSGVLNTKRVPVGGVEEGKQIIRDRLCTTKVLIVLDDVDHHDQLEALAGSVDWFGEDSRVIITTRNMHLLEASGAVAHNMSLLTDDEGIKLFRKHALKIYRPMEDFERLSKEVVSYAGGLPLAIKVFGRLLCGKDMHEWKSALARLKEIPDGDILKKLKISYDGLEPVEKQMFLDIACFFRWEGKDIAMEIFNACDFYPDIGVKALIEKALITISEDGEFDMHDLIQEMAHYIVRGEHPKYPEKHSRIWKEEDVVNICAMDPTTELDMIEAIRYRYQTFFGWDNPLQDVPPIVANTKNLRWIYWRGDLASPLLTNFPQRTLCCLILHDSPQKQLWEGRKYLPNLKTLDLSSLHNLIMTPDFSGLANLEVFKLFDCPYLEVVHSSLGNLKRLVTLSIEHCDGIKVFPSIKRLTNLKTLSFSLSPGLLQLSMGNLPHLHLDKIGECCLEEPFLAQNNHIHLWFPYSDLTKLNLKSCHLGDKDMGSSVCELPNLQELDLGFNEFSRLDFSLLRVPKLKWLSVFYCKNLVELSHLPSSIAVVWANNCPSLETFGDISSCKWLSKVGLCKGYKVDPVDGGILLDSMLQGNAIEDHLISVCLEHQIPMGFVGRFFSGKTFTKRLWDNSGMLTLRLPHVWGNPFTDVFQPYMMFTLRLPPDWYNDFCGFLIRVVTQKESMSIDISIKQEADEEDSGFEIWQESDEAPEPEYDQVRTYVGYVSFNSLRRISLLTSYNLVSFIIKTGWTSFTAELVPRKNKDYSVETTDCSEFWEEKGKNGSGFAIKMDSKSCIKISWFT